MAQVRYTIIANSNDWSRMRHDKLALYQRALLDRPGYTSRLSADRQELEVIIEHPSETIAIDMAIDFEQHFEATRAEHGRLKLTRHVAAESGGDPHIKTTAEVTIRRLSVVANDATIIIGRNRLDGLARRLKSRPGLEVERTGNRQLIIVVTTASTEATERIIDRLKVHLAEFSQLQVDDIDQAANTQPLLAVTQPSVASWTITGVRFQALAQTFLRTAGSVTRVELAQQLGVDFNIVWRYVSAGVKAGYLEPIGPTRNQRFVLTIAGREHLRAYFGYVPTSLTPQDTTQLGEANGNR